MSTKYEHQNLAGKVAKKTDLALLWGRAFVMGASTQGKVSYKFITPVFARQKPFFAQGGGVAPLVPCQLSNCENADFIVIPSL